MVVVFSCALLQTAAGMSCNYVKQYSNVNSEQECDDECSEFAQHNFNPTSFTTQYITPSMFSSNNNCACYGIMNPCAYTEEWTAERVLEKLLRKQNWIIYY